VLWHVTERFLQPGDEITSGRYGRIVRERGLQHPHCHREQLLELCREQLKITISRLECAYAFDDLATAINYAKEKHDEAIFEVEPVDTDAIGLRLDILWLTWMVEPGSTDDQQKSWAVAYWRGESTIERMTDAQPAWEILYPCGLRALRRRR
jgi:hypothetical protein